MRINRERMKEEKKKADKKLMEQIKTDPKVYKDCINDLKEIKKALSKISKGVDDDIIESVYQVAESALYEALASGLKRKDIAFYEKYVDKEKIACKEAIKNNRKQRKIAKQEWDKLFEDTDKRMKELDNLFK